MREWCHCGAAIRASRRDVIRWRDTHRCPDKPEEAPEPEGAQAHVEQAYEAPGRFDGQRFIPTINASIGFTPNPAIDTPSDPQRS